MEHHQEEEKMAGGGQTTQENLLYLYLEKLGFALGDQGKSENALKSVTQLRLNFEFCRESKSYLLEKLKESKSGSSPGKQNPILSLETVTKFMEENPSSSFSCGKFGFSGGSLAEVDIQEFFTLHGSRIKELELDVCCEKDGKFDLFRDLLLVQVPNLNLLHIKTASLTSTKSRDLFSGCESAVLPNLKNLLVVQDYFLKSSILKEVIEKAPNLDFCGVFPREFERSENLELYLRLGQVDKITSHNIRITPENINVYEKFAGCSPKLCHLGFWVEPAEFFKMEPQLQSQISEIVISISKSSQGSVDFIRNFEYFGILNPDQITAAAAELSFEKISSIALSPFQLMKFYQDEQPSQVPYKIFPGPSLSKLFPSLAAITIDCDCLERVNELYWKNQFPLDEKDEMKGVKELEIFDLRSSAFILGKLASLFPNTEKLIIREVWDFPQVASVIWTKFLKLKNLDVELRLGPDCERNSFPALDSAFTGLSEQLVQKYWKSGDTNLDSMRNGQSIADLQGLEDLRIKLVHDNGDKIRNWSLFSRLTGLYGFTKIPGLKTPAIKLNIPCEYVHDKIEDKLSPLSAGR